MKKLFLAAAVLILSTAAQSYARPGDPFTQFGCGSNTVSKGDPADKVLQYCGQPTSIERQVRENTYYDRKRKTTGRAGADELIEQWLYNFGPRTGMVQMNFSNGNLVSIIDRGAGY